MKIEVRRGTSPKVKRLIFDLLDVFELIGVPLSGTERRLERMAKACLAVGGVKTDFSEAQSVDDGKFSRTRDIIAYENKYYGELISSGSYDNIRRQDLKLLLEAGIVVNSSSVEAQATKNPSRGYGLSASFVKLLNKYGTPNFDEELSVFRTSAKSLKDELDRRRELQKVPVTLPGGKKIELTFGSHNRLQKAIVEEFLPLFGFGAEVLYIGDTDNKYLHLEKEELEKIKFYPLEHEELPDVIAYSAEKNLLYLIEAFYSTGEWDEIRVRKIRRKLEEAGCSAELVFFTAFEDRNSFRQKAKDIAWETEVWIADNPEHLVHFNGLKYLEVYR